MTRVRSRGRGAPGTTIKVPPQVTDTARRRLVTMAVLMFAGFAAVAIRLFDVAVLSPAAEPPSLRVEGVAAPVVRAEIVDRGGMLVASSLRTASLYAQPRLVLDPREAARELASVLLESDERELYEALTSDRSFVWLARNLAPRQQNAVHRLGLPGLDFQRSERRVYPHGAAMVHALGFTGIDNDGLAGLEKSFDQALRAGGSPLVTSLDVRVQQIMRAELAAQIAKFGAIGGGGVVLDVDTGEVIALVSLPDFDPHEAGEAGEAERFNRMSLGVYELGSVFKIFNHALALDSGVVNMAGGYDASNSLRVARFTISDYHGKARWLSVPEIFMFSSNIASAKMAADIGGPAQRAFLDALGMLRPSAIELPEVGTPLAPSPWRDINTMTIGFGHGIAVSPLQLAVAVAAVVNGGVLRQATLLKRPPGDAVPGNLVISAATSDQMRRLLRLVVTHGTGRNAAAPGYLVGGKTGTAEKQIGGRYAAKSLISSFVGVFPMNRPRYVVLAILDEPKGNAESLGYATGGWTAAPAVGRIIAQMAPLLGIAPIDEDAAAVRRAMAISINSLDPKVAAF